MKASRKQTVHVVAAVIRARDGRVLVSLRPADYRHGGMWEFPGGKLEPDERPLQGLARELREELGIAVRSGSPLIQLCHEYDHNHVYLDVWEIDDWADEPRGLEGQEIKWVEPRELVDYCFPAANKTVVRACALPRLQLVTPEPDGDDDRFIESLSQCLAAGVRLIQLRAKSYGSKKYEELAIRVLQLCRNFGARLLLNADVAMTEAVGADGLHLSGEYMSRLRERPLGPGRLVGASCHNANQLRQAENLEVDFVLLSPVRRTLSHPDTAPLGWRALRRLVQTTSLPVYALGGVEIEDLERAVRAGCVGSAMVRGLWRDRATERFRSRIDTALGAIRRMP